MNDKDNCPISATCQCLNKASTALQPVLLLLLRLCWGWQFFLTGQGKFAHHSSVTEYFTSLGLPAPDLLAWMVAGIECVGGLFLLAGLFSRPVALLLCCSMLGAYLSIPEDRLALFSILQDPTSFTTTTPFLFLLVSLIVLAFGPGLFSADAFLGHLHTKKQ